MSSQAPNEETVQPLKIIRLDAMHCPAPTLNIPHFMYTEYPSTPLDDAIIIQRIADADVVITTRVPVTAAAIAACPRLKHVALLAIGYDLIDLKACRNRGIRVSHVPAASNEAVAEHAISLYFALRRNVVGMHAKMIDEKEEWKAKGSLTSYWGGLPRTCREETLCIIGGGDLGTRVATIACSLSMRVLIAERKPTPTNPGSNLPPITTRPSRTPFTQALQQSTVIVLTVPYNPGTANTIGAEELKLMREDALIINVARGGLVDEEALVQALRERRIAGAAADVFLREPAYAESNIQVRTVQQWKDDPELCGRLILTPHVAWYARSSIDKLRTTVQTNVEAWARQYRSGTAGEEEDEEIRRCLVVP